MQEENGSDGAQDTAGRHHSSKHKIQTLRFVLSKDTNNISPLVLWTDLIARKLVGETYHFSSRFISRTRIGPGEKVIFKIFQHPMLWGVYPEVLMALAQNSWQIWNSSNRLGDKSLHLCLKEPVRKRSQSCWGFYPYGGPSKKNCTTISGMLGGIFWPMTLAATRSEHPEKVLFLSDIGQKRVKKWC